MIETLSDHRHMVETSAGYIWQAPARLPPTLIEEARQAIGPRREYMRTFADRRTLVAWLTKLGRGCIVSGTMTVDGALSKLKSFAEDFEDRPAFCFTEDTRKAAARQFKYFPSFAELAAFFDEIEKPYHERIRRLGQVIRARPADDEPVDEETALRNRQTIGRMMGHWKDLLAGKITADEYKARVEAERNPA